MKDKKYIRKPQKLVSFTNSQADLDRISADMKNGWCIINLVQNGNYYVAIMELCRAPAGDNGSEQSVFIPPRKRLKIVKS